MHVRLWGMFAQVSVIISSCRNCRFTSIVLSKVTVALMRLGPYSLTDYDYAICSFAKPPGPAKNGKQR
jgi:hypothetical protein